MNDHPGLMTWIIVCFVETSGLCADWNFVTISNKAIRSGCYGGGCLGSFPPFDNGRTVGTDLQGG